MRKPMILALLAVLLSLGVFFKINAQEGGIVEVCIIYVDSLDEVDPFGECPEEKLSIWQQLIEKHSEQASGFDLGTADTSTWKVIPNIAEDSDDHKIDGEIWEMPRTTHYAVTTANGRYEAVESTEVGGDFGWCGDTQFDCPPHLGLFRFSVPPTSEQLVQDLTITGDMQISYRFHIANTSEETQVVRFQWRFNNGPDGRTLEELLADYDSAASGASLVLMVATETGEQDAGTLTLIQEEKEVRIPFGYSCWDCLAHTTGPGFDAVSELDPSILDFVGPGSPPLSSGLLSGLIWRIPKPDVEPDFEIDTFLEIPAGTTIVIWLGSYTTK